MVAPSLHAQTSNDLFNESAVQTLQITIHSRDWESLRVNFTSNDFYPADVTWNGIRVRNVGIRSRGLGSRSGVKPGLEVNFAHYSSRGQFLGMRALVLDNLTTDPSMIRERVAMAFLRRFGVPAPREVHAQLYVNGQYSGLYAIVEPIDSVFLQRTLGENSGTLYEFHWLQPYFATFLGEDLDLYEPFFEPRTQETQSTFDLFDPIRELFRTINSAPAASFRDAVNAAARPRVHAAAHRRRDVPGRMGRHPGLRGDEQLLSVSSPARPSRLASSRGMRITPFRRRTIRCSRAPRRTC